MLIIHEKRRNGYVRILRAIAMTLKDEDAIVRQVLIPGEELNVDSLCKVLGGDNPNKGKTYDSAELLHFLADMMET